MSGFSVCLRTATHWDAFVAEQEGIFITPEEGAVMIVDGKRTAYVDEYGTATVLPWSSLSQETAEGFAGRAMDVWAESTPEKEE